MIQLSLVHGPKPNQAECSSTNTMSELSGSIIRYYSPSINGCLNLGDKSWDFLSGENLSSCPEAKRTNNMYSWLDLRRELFFLS